MEEERMPNQIYQQMMGNQQQQAQNQFSSFMQNPFAFLAQRKLNIPAEYQNDPHSAVDYLINSGKMDQNAFNKVFQTLQSMGFKF